LFGNIDTVSEVETCLELAVEALAYGYEQITNNGEHKYTAEYLLETIRGKKPEEDYGLFDEQHGPQPMRDQHGLVITVPAGMEVNTNVIPF
jgi:hypothetical protein